MDIKYLDTFIKVTELKSFTLAAERLHITQPGVSKQIQRLETELGTVLFHRGEADIALTEAGQAVYQSAKILLADWSALQSRSQQYSGQLTGQLTVGASTIPCKHLLSGILQAFYVACPTVEVTVHSDDSSGILAAVESGAIDIALLGSKPSSSDVSFVQIGSDQLVVIGPPSLAADSNWRHMPFILRLPGSGTRLAADEVLRELGILPEGLICPLQTNDIQLILQMVRLGIGLAIVSSLDAAEAIDCGHAKIIQELPVKRNFYLIERRSNEQSLLHRTFVEIALRVLQVKQPESTI